MVAYSQKSFFERSAKMKRFCSFCGQEENEHSPMIAGINAFICHRCAKTASELLEEKVEDQEVPSEMFFVKKPHEIKKELDKYVVGQEEAKKLLSVAVYNHYKRIFSPSNVDIQKSNILMIGPSGSGKTYLVQTLAKILDVPLVIADATSLTEAGYVGEDVESIIEKLLIKANGDVERAEKGIVYIDEIDKIAAYDSDSEVRVKDVGGRGVQEALLKIIEDDEVFVNLGKSVFHRNKVSVKTRNILFIGGGAFVGLDKIIQKRTSKGSRHIGFIPSPISSNSKEKDILHEDLINFGLIPELVGRMPVIVSLHSLTKEDLSRILTKPQNAILKQYQSLFRMDGVKLKFQKDAIDYIAEEALKKNIGARGLRAILEKKMYQLMFELPQYSNIKDLTITKEMLMGIEPIIPALNKEKSGTSKK